MTVDVNPPVAVEQPVPLHGGPVLQRVCDALMTWLRVGDGVVRQIFFSWPTVLADIIVLMFVLNVAVAIVNAVRLADSADEIAKLRVELDHALALLRGDVMGPGPSIPGGGPAGAPYKVGACPVEDEHPPYRGCGHKDAPPCGPAGRDDTRAFRGPSALDDPPAPLGPRGPSELKEIDELDARTPYGPGNSAPGLAGKVVDDPFLYLWPGPPGKNGKVGCAHDKPPRRPSGLKTIRVSGATVTLGPDGGYCDPKTCNTPVGRGLPGAIGMPDPCDHTVCRRLLGHPGQPGVDGPPGMPISGMPDKPRPRHSVNHDEEEEEEWY